MAYDITFLSSAEQLSANSGYELVKFFFLMTFAAAIPAIISGGIAERARFYPMLVGSFFTVGLVYPFFEGLIWNSNYGFQDWLAETFGAPFHDFAGSVVVHSVGGWIAWLLSPCWESEMAVIAVVALSHSRRQTFHYWLWARGS